MTCLLFVMGFRPTLGDRGTCLWTLPAQLGWPVLGPAQPAVTPGLQKASTCPEVVILFSELQAFSHGCYVENLGFLVFFEKDTQLHTQMPQRPHPCPQASLRVHACVCA